MKRNYIIGLVAVIVVFVLYSAISRVEEPPVVGDQQNQPPMNKHDAAMIAGSKNLGNNPEKMKFLIGKASKGDVEIQRYLGSVYTSGREGVIPDLSVAAEWYTMAALRGDSDSQIKLADMYIKGEGVGKDVEKAIVYLEKAAKGLGRAVDAQMILGSMYYKGEEVYKNDEKALLWFIKAAKSGKVQAQSMLGLIYSTSEGLVNLQEAARWYEMAAEQGDVNAEFNYGLMLFEGKGGIGQDYEQALMWFKKAMAQHHQGAQTYVGAMYANGLGTPQDYSLALRWLIPVAEEGYVFAQGTIADIYTKEGNVNNVRAYMWYEIAFRNGLEEVKNLRDNIGKGMKNKEIAEAIEKADTWIKENAKKQAAKKEKAAARKRESDSMF